MKSKLLITKVCKHGHELTPETIIVRQKVFENGRVHTIASCRVCARIRARAYQKKLNETLVKDRALSVEEIANLLNA